MKIVQAASEFYPFIKTGGLADVTSALSKSLASYGHEISVFLPGYRTVLESPELAKAKSVATIQVEVGQEFLRGDVLEVKLAKGLTLFVIRRDEFFDRRFAYSVSGRDYDDNERRFTFFSKAIVESIHVLDLKADILHCHDWQTGLAPLLLRLEEQKTGNSYALKTFFTIHNMSFQGLFPKGAFRFTNLPAEFMSLEGLEFFGQISFMKAGILFADKIITVSPSYAKEILTPDFGYGMDGTLKSREEDLIGIVNGIDVDEWNPGSDPALPAKYSRSKMVGKAECRKKMLETVGLSDSEENPVYGIVCRLTPQKGIDLLLEQIKFFVKNDCRLVVLGRGEEPLQKALRKAAKDYPKHVAVRIEMNEELAHLIEAGSDFFLLPSVFEPCGLNQMYSQRYGTIPLASNIGGLKDTVLCHRDDPEESTGISFEPNKKAFSEALSCSMELYSNPKTFKQMQHRAMSKDFSWKTAAKKYEQIYLDSV
ncbi:glycogen synthase GlgA [Puniceicoccaceae bacterium K14]|nr:glycogen synthase GlgA [Puniceicoccaceae bacterium K14]